MAFEEYLRAPTGQVAASEGFHPKDGPEGWWIDSQRIDGVLNGSIGQRGSNTGERQDRHWHSFPEAIEGEPTHPLRRIGGGYQGAPKNG
jgi:hypothetical protein